MKKSRANPVPDPLEELVAKALDFAGITYLRENDNDATLDFYLPDFDVYIEVKNAFTERSVRQMARARRVIMLQSKGAVILFCRFVKAFGKTLNSDDQR